jgi:hypothetical protein
MRILVTLCGARRSVARALTVLPDRWQRAVRAAMAELRPVVIDGGHSFPYPADGLASTADGPRWRYPTWLCAPVEGVVEADLSTEPTWRPRDVGAGTAGRSLGVVVCSARLYAE